MSLTKKALSQFLNDQTNERLKNAISVNSPSIESSIILDNADILSSADGNEIETTADELEGYYIVKAISRSLIESKRIFYRDAKSYFSILVDNNNRKPLCRLHLNGNKKYISLFDENKSESRHEIDSLDEIYNFADQIALSAKQYL